MKYTIDINCDMAEGFETDEAIMPYISSANIACGYHAGDSTIMLRTAEAALKHQVSIGAHPGFADKPNFGRTEIQMSLAAVYDMVSEQLFALQKITDQLGTTMRHVKPHGALYNMSARDAALACTIASAVFDFNRELVLFGLSGSFSITEASQKGLRTASEVFADRTYQDNGQLTPRSQPLAMIMVEEDSVKQVLQMIEQKRVSTVSGKEISITADTVCVHGDGAHACSFAKKIYQSLQQKNIGIKSI